MVATERTHMEMTLTGNRILVKPDEVTEWHGIAIPLSISHMENPFSEARIGTVMAIGVGRLTRKGKRIPIEIKVGDRVILPRDNKIHVTVDDAFHWLLNADEVIGILE